MKTHMKATDPNKMEFTLEITMTLKDWRELDDQLSTAYPSWELASRITDMVQQATQHFTPEERS